MQNETPGQGWWWVALRVVPACLVLASMAAGVYLLEAALDGAEHRASISLSILFVLPFCLAAITMLFVDTAGNKGAGFYTKAPLGAVGALLVLGAVLLREGVVCLVMIAPLWAVSAVAGSFLVFLLRRQLRRSTQLNCVALVALPFAALLGEPALAERSQDFTVTRTIEITEAPNAIWPYLLQLDNISDREGVWTVPQNLLGIPRPRSAIVSGEGLGAQRHARWGDSISFIEEITDWAPGRRLGWRFIFSNDSISRFTDRHISPVGPHLSVLSGEYELASLQGGRARLSLRTTYRVTTHVNHYSAAWGEVILGGVETNILAIVKERVERHPLATQ